VETGAVHGGPGFVGTGLFVESSVVLSWIRLPRRMSSALTMPNWTVEHGWSRSLMGLKASTYAERFRGPAGFPTECLAPPAVGAFTQVSGGFAALNGSNVNEGLTETVMLLSLFK
jgi:hypothetical protein